MTFEQALEAYARQTWPALFRDKTATSFTITHEEEYTNDNGTSWPASIDISWTATWETPTGRPRSRKFTVSAGSDPIEFMRGLFALTEKEAMA